MNHTDKPPGTVMDKRIEDQCKLAYTRLSGAVNAYLAAGARPGSREHAEALKQMERYVKDLAALARETTEMAVVWHDCFGKYIGLIRQSRGLDLHLEALAPSELDAMLAFLVFSKTPRGGIEKADLERRLIETFDGEQPAIRQLEESGARDGPLDEVTVYCDTITDMTSLNRKIEEVARLYDKHEVDVPMPEAVQTPVGDLVEQKKQARRAAVRRELKDLPFTGGEKIFRFVIQEGVPRVSVAHSFD